MVEESQLKAVQEFAFLTEQVLVECLSVSEVSDKLLVDITNFGREITLLDKFLSIYGIAQAEGGC